MVRPCFLVVDQEFPGSISSRKLVLETAKFNVITAYSSEEALETLRRFPAIDAAVLNGQQQDMPYEQLIVRLRELLPELPIVVTTPAGFGDSQSKIHYVPSYEPEQLLITLRKVCAGEAKRLLDREASMREATLRREAALHNDTDPEI